jgi:hypothetical protein
VRVVDIQCNIYDTDAVESSCKEWYIAWFRIPDPLLRSLLHIQDHLEDAVG